MNKNKTQIKSKKVKSLLIPYIILLIVLLGTSLYFGNYILWLSFFFLLTFIAVDLIYFFYKFNKLDIKFEITKQIIPCDEPLKVITKVKFNGKTDILQNYTVSIKREDLKKPLNIFVNNKNDFLVDTEKIGEFLLNVKCIYIKSYFGFFVKKKDIQLEDIDNLRYVVIPANKKLNEDKKIILNPNLTASNLVYVKREYHDYIGNREYVPGDPLKFINYKKSAALRKNIVKEYSSPSLGPAINIFVDKIEDESYTQIANSIVALNNYYLKQGNAVTILTFFDGQQRTYTDKNYKLLPYELSTISIKKNKDKDFKFFNFKMSNLPVVLILSSFDKDVDLTELENLPNNSMIFLVGDAIKYRLKIQTTLIANNDYIFLSDYSKIKD